MVELSLKLIGGEGDEKREIACAGKDQPRNTKQKPLYILPHVRKSHPQNHCLAKSQSLSRQTQAAMRSDLHGKEKGQGA